MYVTYALFLHHSYTLILQLILFFYILRAVTEGISYYHLKARLEIPYAGDGKTCYFDKWKNPRVGNSKKSFKGGFIIKLFIIFLIGMLVGCVVTLFIFCMRSVGSLRIDTSDPDDGPYLFLEMSKDINKVCKKKYITLKVNLKNFIPHE